jgi:N-methylhydantoinase B/oxoprolinase/acetone carboxylase alpha subunit
MQYTVENTTDPFARGLDGGEDGEPGVHVLNPGTPREAVMTDRVTPYGPLWVGDLLSARSGGGGGFGHPEDLAT